MTIYKHILVGLDLSDECFAVLKKAKELAGGLGSKLSVAHVCEPISFAYGGDIPFDLNSTQELIVKRAETRLNEVITQVGLDPFERLVVIGQAAHELHRLADEKAADLILVGSHGRHGFALLLGSTSTGVLHGAHCDVLAVRV
ncbi:MAG: universal stress protein UspA [Alteromonadaceae bacterium]|nr:MAG: universal stress protein UspA [Alteromonadaceae bacterium]